MQRDTRIGSPISTALTQWLRSLLMLSIGAAVLASVADTVATVLLLRAGPAAGAMEAPGVLALVRLGLGLLTGALVLAWTWRASRNAHGLGAAGLRFTPGWAAGWFVVPLANLVKPPQVLRELWQASSEPHFWTTEPAPRTITWCWRLLLTALLFAAAAAFGRADGGNMLALVSAGMLAVAADLAAAGACWLLLVLITDIHRMQMSHADRQALLELVA